MKCNTERINELADAVVREMAGEETRDLLQIEGRLCAVMQQVSQASLRHALEGMVVAIRRPASPARAGPRRPIATSVRARF